MPGTRSLDLGGIHLPLDLVTESNALLGKKGSGKTTRDVTRVTIRRIHEWQVTRAYWTIGMML
jgi:hypothetical protein